MHIALNDRVQLNARCPYFIYRFRETPICAQSETSICCPFDTRGGNCYCMIADDNLGKQTNNGDINRKEAPQYESHFLYG